MSGIIAERGALHRNLGSCLFGGDRFRNRTSIGTATFTSHASIVSGPGRRSSPSKVMILENAGTPPRRIRSYLRSSQIVIAVGASLSP